MRITSARVWEAFKILKCRLPVPEDCEVFLSCYNPGDGNRWQVQVIRDYGILYTFPNSRHIKTRDFYHYIDGITDFLYRTDLSQSTKGGI